MRPIPFSGESVLHVISHPVGLTYRQSVTDDDEASKSKFYWTVSLFYQLNVMWLSPLLVYANTGLNPLAHS